MYNYFKICIISKLIFPLVILLFLFSLIDCGAYKENEKINKESKKQKSEQLKLESERIRIQEIERKFDAVYFPPENINSFSYSYEVQKIFQLHSKDNIVFKGFIDDIEIINDIVHIDFSCHLGEFYFLGKSILFRLSISEKMVDNFLNKNNQNVINKLLMKMLNKPDYYVKCKILNTQILRKYTFSGSSYSEEVEIEQDVLTNLVAIGQFLDYAIIPEDNK